jgi:hypothetical protein
MVKRMMQNRRLIDSLFEEFSDLEVKLTEWLDGVPITKLDFGGGGVVYVGPSRIHASPSADQKVKQCQLLQRYKDVMLMPRLLSQRAAQGDRKSFMQADLRILQRLELKDRSCLCGNKEKDIAGLKADAQKIKSILSILGAMSESEVIVIPDTSALIDHPFPQSYSSFIGISQFVFLLLPTVLGELDNIKNRNRSNDRGERARTAIRMISGFREQGSLRNGVAVNGIRVRSESREPDMSTTLSWLDKDVGDDRIIAGALEVQLSSPSSRVVLVTLDINLANKADSARLEVIKIGD